MSPNAYDPFKDESLINPLPAPKKTRIRVDWKRGAQMMARGETADAIAAALNITAERLWKHFRRSLRFQFLFRVALEQARLEAQLAFEEQARRAVIARCGSIAEIDAASWQWLAGQGGIAQDPPHKDEEPGKRELRLVASLKHVGRAPPNQAFHQRIKKERKVMDAQFAELKAWGRAQGILPADDKTAEAPPAGGNEIRLSENKTQISTDKTAVSKPAAPHAAESGTKSTRQAIAPRTPEDDGDDIAPPALSPDLPVMPRHLLGSVTDLTDGDGVPLPQTNRHARA